MSEERRKRLNSIGFTWNDRKAQEAFHWEVRFQELVEYKRVHRDCNAPRRYQPNPQLGTWVSTQRENKEKMSEERRNMLDSIGFVWKFQEAQLAFHWEVRFQQLVDYKRVYGNCHVPQRFKENKQLGKWVSTQRENKEKMSEEKRKMLDSIGFVWKFQEAQYAFHWEVRFQQLVEYKRVHRDCNVPQRYKANPQLGSWVIAQRTKEETMSKNKRNQLNSVGFVWRLTAARPNQQRQVRPSTVEGPKKKKLKLDDEASQGDKGSGHEAWDSYFKQLCEFVKTYKHCNVPLQHSELGRWAEEQRQLYERKQIGRGMETNLTNDQEAKLMAAGFDFGRTLNIPDDDDLYSM